jgi:hypothetical protein
MVEIAVAGRLVNEAHRRHVKRLLALALSPVQYDDLGRV